MKTIIIKTQEELNELKFIKEDEEVIVENNGLTIDWNIEIYGIFKFFGDIKKYATIKTLGSSQATIKTWDSSQATIKMWGSSQATIETWDSSQATIKTWGSSQATIKTWGSSVVTVLSIIQFISLFGYSLLMNPLNLKLNIKKERTTTVITPKWKKGITGWLQREEIEKTDNIILYKKVSKDFKTQENTINEILWKIGSVVEHPYWNPKKEECGKGKFHACSRAFFCDQFRNENGDKYIAIEIDLKDIYVWEDNPEYQHKVAFKKGKVLYECDINGKNITT